MRFIGNRSSGRMGWRWRPRRRDAAPTSPSSRPTSLPRRLGVRTVEVETTGELAAAVAAEFAAANVLLMAAAPADFRAADPEAEKISREGGGMRLALEPTEDILAGVAEAPSRRPDARRLRRRDRRLRRARPSQARAQGGRRDRPQRRLALGHRLRLDQQRGDDRRALRASITPGRPRTTWPRRSSTGSRLCGPSSRSTT